MKIDDLRGYLRIDKNHLDDEIVRQPSTFFEVCEGSTQAAAERDFLKEALAETDAMLDQKARLFYEKGGEKYTEAMVKGWVQLNKDHADATELYINAKEKADRWDALRDAFQQRAYMLRDLCQLHNAQYYSESSVQGTNATDTARYHANRERMAAEREKR